MLARRCRFNSTASQSGSVVRCGGIRGRVGPCLPVSEGPGHDVRGMVFARTKHNVEGHGSVCLCPAKTRNEKTTYTQQVQAFQTLARNDGDLFHFTQDGDFRGQQAGGVGECH